MPKKPQLQPQLIAEILDQTIRLYRRAFWPLSASAAGAYTITWLLQNTVRRQFERQTQADFTLNGLLNLQIGLPDLLLLQMVGGLTLAQMITLLVLVVGIYLILQVLLYTWLIPVTAESYLSNYTDLLPAREFRLIWLLQLLPTAILLLPFGWLMATTTSLIANLALVVELTSYGEMLWPELLPLLQETSLILAILAFVTALVARLWYAPQATIIEHHGPLHSLQRSWRLTHGAWGSTAVLALVTSLLSSVLLVLPQLAFSTVHTLIEVDSLISQALVLLVFVIEVLLLPLPIIVMTIGYYDRRVKQEGYQIELAARQALIERGDQEYLKGHYAAALVSYEQALEQVPTNFHLHWSYVKATYHIGDTAMALARAEAALALFPRFADAWLLRALVRYGSGDHSGATNDFSQARKLQNNKTQATLKEATVLHMTGDYDAARELLLKTLEKQPLNSSVIYNIACGYAQQQQLDTALQWLQRAVALNKQWQPYAAADPDFAALHNHPGFLAVTGQKIGKG